MRASQFALWKFLKMSNQEPPLPKDKLNIPNNHEQVIEISINAPDDFEIPKNPSLEIESAIPEDGSHSSLDKFNSLIQRLNNI
jgi:hypothetical protein